MVKKELFAVFLAFALAQAHSDDVDLQNAVKELLSNALQIKIVARVLPHNEKPIWDMDITKLTVPGRSVAVQLVGNNIQIFAIFTPYKQPDDTLLLVAQGQIWLTEPPENEVKYLSTFRSIPITLGEKILFFPLGLTSEIVKKDYFNIELEIQIVPYRE